MDIIPIIGLGGAALTTIAFIPQVMRSYTTRQTRDLSLGWMGCLIAGFILWLIYGSAIHDLPLILANILSLILVLSLLVMKIKWGMGK